MGIYHSKAIGTEDNIKLEVTARDLDSIDVTPPPEFKGPEGHITPEDLFSMSISSCYILTFKALAKYKKMNWQHLEVDVDAKLEKTSSGLKFTTVDIYPKLTVCCESNIDPFLELLMKAKESCLVTQSMNCEFNLKPKIKVKAKA
jgi:organic hydroperoxide reductase OsmC/OhrA